MLGRTEISDTSPIGPRCPCSHHPAFSQRISWQKRVLTVWPQWLYQPWPRLWIDPSSLTGPSVQSEPCATTWTGTLTCFLREVYFFGTELIPLFPYLRAGLLKKGGGGRRVGLDQLAGFCRLTIALRVPDPGSTQA